MAWPTNSKASTTNVDSPTDSITSARADIQQNISNVNNIIDTFDIGGDSSGQLVDGDILKYDSASSKFIPVASTSISGGADIAYLQMLGNAGENVSGNIYRRPTAVIHNPGFITQPGDTGFGAHYNSPTGENFYGQADLTYAAGTYIITATPVKEADGEVPTSLYDETNTTELDSQIMSYGEVGTSSDGFFGLTNGAPVKVVLTGSTRLSFRQNTATSSNRNVSLGIQINKVA